MVDCNAKSLTVKMITIKTRNSTHHSNKELHSCSFMSEKKINLNVKKGKRIFNVLYALCASRVSKSKGIIRMNSVIDNQGAYSHTSGCNDFHLHIKPEATLFTLKE